MSILVDIAKDVGKALIPQQEQSEPIHVYRWRQTVAFSIISLGVVMGLHIAWVAGFLSFIGLQGYASAADVKSQQAQLTEIRVTQIETQIRAAKVANCLAQRDNNMPALAYSAKDLADRLNDYYNVTGHIYPRIPECVELLASKSP